MSRYLERAEHAARLIDLNLHQMLDQSPVSVETRWERLLKSLRTPSLDNLASHNAYEITNTLTFDPSNKSSIVSYISLARDNARQVREQISSEMWEQLNGLCLQVKRTSMAEIWQDEPHQFFQSVKDGAHLFLGITEATMSHGEGWQFIQLGRYIERAGATSALRYLPHTPA
ncbi:MAG: alpha-E domain-containing protein [Pyrinomonadaceae bacterium]